jgi:hypothetical protein
MPVELLCIHLQVNSGRHKALSHHVCSSYRRSCVSGSLVRLFELLGIHLQAALHTVDGTDAASGCTQLLPQIVQNSGGWEGPSLPRKTCHKGPLRASCSLA